MNKKASTLIKPKKKMVVLIDSMWLKSRLSLNGVALELAYVPYGLSLSLT
jgi:hypothetical protein